MLRAIVKRIDNGALGSGYDSPAIVTYQTCDFVCQQLEDLLRSPNPYCVYVVVGVEAVSRLSAHYPGATPTPAATTATTPKAA